MINKAELMLLIEGDQELLGSLIELYSQDWPPLVQQIRVAFKDEDREQIKKSAHRLKGNLRNFYSSQPAELASKIEEGSENLSFNDLKEYLIQLEPQLKEVEQHLKDFLNEMQTKDKVN